MIEILENPQMSIDPTRKNLLPSQEIMSITGHQVKNHLKKFKLILLDNELSRPVKNEEIKIIPTNQAQGFAWKVFEK